MSRVVELNRGTSESSVELRLDLDGTGVADSSTGVGVYDLARGQGWRLVRVGD